MARIKIENLPKNQKVSIKEMRKVVGGTYILYSFSLDISGFGSGLSKEMKLFESPMEELRNEKQMHTTEYERSDSG